MGESITRLLAPGEPNVCKNLFRRQQTGPLVSRFILPESHFNIAKADDVAIFDLT